MVARMNSRVLSIVTSLVGAWTAIYTTGMPRTLRETRRNEIASDLWECCANVARGGQSVRHAAAEVLARLFLGIPDDIFWRWENEMNTTSTNGHIPLWINTTGLGIPLSALAVYLAAAFSNTLNDSTVAVTIRDSRYIFPALLSVHVIAICAFIGAAAMVDLRMLGWTFKRTPVLEVGQSVLPWAMGGFALLLASGAFAYLAEPARLTHNIFFNLKIGMLAVGGLNAWASHRRVFRHSGEWDQAGRIPGRDRLAAAFSLLIWGLLIVSGQLTGFAA